MVIENVQLNLSWGEETMMTKLKSMSFAADWWWTCLVA